MHIYWLVNCDIPIIMKWWCNKSLLNLWWTKCLVYLFCLEVMQMFTQFICFYFPWLIYYLFLHRNLWWKFRTGKIYICDTISVPKSFDCIFATAPLSHGINFLFKQPQTPTKLYFMDMLSGIFTHIYLWFFILHKI